jgi:hypothetical protein
MNRQGINVPIGAFLGVVTIFTLSGAAFASGNFATTAADATVPSRAPVSSVGSVVDPAVPTIAATGAAQVVTEPLPLRIVVESSAATSPGPSAGASDPAAATPGAPSPTAATTSAAEPAAALAATAAPRETVAPAETPVSAPAATPVPAPTATTGAAAPTAAPTAASVAGSTAAPTAASTPRTWSLDLYYTGAQRWQDPDYTACTAAATLSMLNTIAHDGTGAGLVWKPTTSYSVQGSILSYERAHMTMLESSAGTDPHGWRNALNYYGWGSIDAGVYVDTAYGSFDAAAKAAVSAIARTGKPVGILGWAGGHAQFITGYTVTGADPATGSTAFTVVGVRLTDPLRADGYRDTNVTVAQWKSGNLKLRFRAYTQTDSPYRDPIDGRVGKSEWFGKWVIIRPVK